MGESTAARLAGLVIDAVVAAALQYELDKDRAALRERLHQVVGIVGAAAATAG
jgi:hypothetical protein